MTQSKQPDIIRCWECKEELAEAGAIGGFTSIRWFCPACLIYYSDTEPVAVMRGNKIIKI